MIGNRVYLDNNATTPIAPEVVAAMAECYAQRMANPSSQHQSGRMAQGLLNKACDSMLAALGCRVEGMEADELILTSGGTEANNLAIFGLANARSGDIVISSIEHPSVLEAAEHLARTTSRRVRFLPVRPNGQVCLDTWEGWLAAHRSGSSHDRLALLSIMLANNETGVCQPVAAIAQAARREGILVHSDSVQVVGKIPFRFSDLEVDAVTISAHKVHGPVGIGGLILRRGIPLEPQLFGGAQQLSRRPGTIPVALVVGMAKAIEIGVDRVARHEASMRELRDRFENQVLHRVPSSIILGSESPRLPHTIAIAFPGFDRQALQMALDRHGIACSTGSACASGSGQPSHVLKAMGLPQAIVDGGLRFSLSRETTASDIDFAVDGIAAVVERLRRR